MTFMYYNFELVMAGAILLTAMLIGGIVLRIKRSRSIDETPDANPLEGADAKNTWPNGRKDTDDARSDSQT